MDKLHRIAFVWGTTPNSEVHRDRRDSGYRKLRWERKAELLGEVSFVGEANAWEHYVEVKVEQQTAVVLVSVLNAIEPFIFSLSFVKNLGGLGIH